MCFREDSWPGSLQPGLVCQTSSRQTLEVTQPPRQHMEMTGVAFYRLYLSSPKHKTKSGSAATAQARILFLDCSLSLWIQYRASSAQEAGLSQPQPTSAAKGDGFPSHIAPGQRRTE